MTLTVTMTKGLPGSGKSHWAKTQVAARPNQVARVNKDSLRALLHEGKHSKANEKLVEDARDALVRAALDRGQSVIVDDTNFASQHEERLRRIAKDYGAEFRVQDFTHVSLEECVKNDLKRGAAAGVVGSKVIYRMHRQFLAPKTGLQLRVPRDETLPDALIVDIDGTLAHMDGRDPYDCSRYHEDLFDAAIADIVAKYRETGVKVIVCSGREDAYREVTETWLTVHDFTWDLFLMRSTGDGRNDGIVKGELYDAHILGRFNVLFVLDDRDRVVRAWRDRGLLCLQVADGDF